MATVAAFAAPLSVAGAEVIPSPRLEGLEPRVARALAEARAGVAEHPGAARAWGRYGMILDAHRLPEEAAQAYAEAERLDSTEMRWPYFLATLHEFVDPERAVAPYLRAIRLAPEYAPARIRLAQALEALGRDAEALAQYERATELESEEPLGWLGRGRIELARGELDRAVAHLERAYAQGPRLQAAAATLSRAYQLAGDTEAARALAARARRLPRLMHHRDPLRAEVRALAVSTESFLERTRTFLDVGLLDQARAEIGRLLRLEPAHAAGWLLRASVEDRAGDSRAALAAARRALELDPLLPGARAVLAGALFKLGRFAEAETEAHGVLAAEPENLHMLLVAGMIALRRGDLGEMGVHLDRAFLARGSDDALQPLLAQLLADLAFALDESGRRARARERLGQAVTVATETGAGALPLASWQARLDAWSRGRS